MKALTLIFALCLALTTLAQEQTDYSQDFINHVRYTYILKVDISYKTVKGGYELLAKNDLTKKLIGARRAGPTEKGLFDDKGHCIRYYFSDLERLNDRGTIYGVQGKSNLYGNLCDFDGSIQLTPHLYQNKDDDQILLLMGHYNLSESAEQYHSGLFRGVYIEFYEVHKDGSLAATDFGVSDDWYGGIGEWINHSTGERKFHTIGQLRGAGNYIKALKSFDLGASELSINPRWASRGWANLRSEAFQAYVEKYMLKELSEYESADAIIEDYEQALNLLMDKKGEYFLPGLNQAIEEEEKEWWE